MTMINTDTPGVTVEVTNTVPVTHRASQVRLQSWYQDEHQGASLVDLRLTPDQAEDVASALNSAAHQARIDNANHGQPCIFDDHVGPWVRGPEPSGER